MGYLVWVEGKGEGQTIPLVKHRTTFGRSNDCDVALTDRKSSRAHAQILLSQGLVVLIDQGSSNGTLVNGMPVRKTFLNFGDRIELGDNAFIYYDGQPEVEPRESPLVDLDLDTINQIDAPDEMATELRTLEDRSAIFAALENTYLQLRTLFTLSRELPKSAGPSEAFALLAQSIHLASGVTRASLWVRTGEGLSPLPDYVETPGETPDPTPPIAQFPRSILDWIERERRPLMLAPGVGPIEAESLPRHPLIVLPIETGSARLGVMVLERLGRTDGFLKRDLDFALAAGGYLALVLADMFERKGILSKAARIEGERFGDIIIGQSQAMRALIAETIRVAEANSSVLILGESGTGKELIARTIHQLSRRSRGPFVAVNCGAIAPMLIESELFGHEKGAFTGAHARKIGRFEAADGGTLFLDEVSELPADAQVKFLRVLQEGEFYRVGGSRPLRCDVRVIAATNRDLQKMIVENRFREDLYFRLNVVELKMPPLRERREDIQPLVEYFLNELRRHIPTTLENLSPQAMRALFQYDWPGNVRQLRNAIEHALVMGKGNLLRLNHLPEYVTLRATDKTDSSPHTPPTEPDVLAALSLADIEKRHIETVLRQCEGNKQQAATRLGISRSTLYEKLRTFGIEE